MELYLSYRDEQLRDLGVQLLNVATARSWSPLAKAFIDNDAIDVVIPLARPEKSQALKPFALGYIPGLPEPSAAGAFMAFVIDRAKGEVVGDPIPIAPERPSPEPARVNVVVTTNGRLVT